MMGIDFRYLDSKSAQWADAGTALDRTNDKPIQTPLKSYFLVILIQRIAKPSSRVKLNSIWVKITVTIDRQQTKERYDEYRRINLSPATLDKQSYMAGQVTYRGQEWDRTCA